MTKYLQSSFSVNMSGSDDYRNRWEETFGKSRALIPVTGDVHRQVRQFHEVFNQPVLDTPTVPSDERVKMRLKLIAEEFVELLEATMGTGFMYSGFAQGDDDYVAETLEHYIDDAEVRVDLVKTADALGDLLYVVHGMCLELGLPIGKVVDEIHRSNLSKLGPDGKPVYRDDGKVTKGPNYVPPNIESILK